MRPIIFAFFLALHATGVGAQDPAPGPDTLRAEQAALFDAMRAAPENLDLMFRYALISIQLADYEQAIATLERMLIFNPDLPRVKLELAVAYFRLGAYEAARFHLEDALGANPPPRVQERIQQFLAQIDERTQTHRFTGYASLGLLYSTNATLGPDDRDVTVSFQNTTVTAQLDPAAVEEDDFGARLTLGLSHIYDMGGTRENQWITRAGYVGQRYRHTHTGGFDIVEGSTGPSLALDDDLFGLRMRPFARGGYVASGQDSLYTNVGGGVEFSNSFGQSVGAFARFNLDWREYVTESSGFTGSYGFGQIGASYLGVPDTRFTLTAILETDRTDDDFNSNYEVGLRLSVSRDLDIAFDEDEAGPWTLSGFGQVSGRWFDDPNPSINPNEKRNDLDLRVGARLYTPITRSLGLAVDASYFDRNSNIRNYDLDNFEIGVSAVARF